MGALIELTHSVTGATVTVGDERVAEIHEKAGWVRTGTVEPAVPDRPADDAPARAWRAYAADLGLDIDQDTIGSTEELVAAIDAHLAASPAPADADTDLPDTAADLIAWIGDDHDRALEAQAAEQARPNPRKTVTEHIESVLNESQED